MARETVGGCAVSKPSVTESADTRAVFAQQEELAKVGDLQKGCVVFSAVWLDRIRNYSGEPGSRINHLSRIEVLENVDNLQRCYQRREEQNRKSAFDDLFQPTFNHFGMNLTNRGFMDVISSQDSALTNLAHHLSESGKSHVLVLIRMDGDHHAIATHQEAGRLHIFDPNSGESVMSARDREVKQALQDIIQNYSYRVPLPEVHLLQAA